MFKIGARLFSLLANPRKKLEKILPELVDLKLYLRQMDLSNPLDEIVRFFDRVSKWHDREAEIRYIWNVLKNGDYGQNGELIVAVCDLELHFRHAGREQYGWNRTKPGETVTEDKIYLGGIYGLFTLTVAQWRPKKDEEKGGWGFLNMEDLNAYDIVSLQAGEFMEKHRGKMIEDIECIQRKLGYKK